MRLEQKSKKEPDGAGTGTGGKRGNIKARLKGQQGSVWNI